VKEKFGLFATIVKQKQNGIKQHYTKPVFQLLTEKITVILALRDLLKFLLGRQNYK